MEEKIFVSFKPKLVGGLTTKKGVKRQMQGLAKVFEELRKYKG